MLKATTSFASVAALTLLVPAPSVSAADLGYSPPVAIQLAPSCWTGFYAGLGGGMTSLNNTLKAQPGPALGASGPTASFDGLGAEGGFFELNVGADYQVNSWLVAGAFFDFDFDDVQSELKISVPGAPLNAQAKLDINHKWSIGGRLGYLASPGTLLYVSGGFTQVSMSDLKFAISGPIDAATSVAIPSFSGGFVGAGAETKLTEHISLRGEYRFTDFGSGSVGLPTINGTNLNDFVSARVAPTMQDTRVSLNYRF